MARKPNLTTREKATLAVVRNNTNDKTIETVHALNEVMEEVSQLMDTLYFMSIRKGAIDKSDLNMKIANYTKAVSEANKLLTESTHKRKIEVSKGQTVKRI